MAQSLPPPVGPDYGLEPLQPDLHTPNVPPITSHLLVSTEDYRTGSEFGGVPGGMIQPSPHVMDNHEALISIYAIDPMDNGSRPDSVLPPA